jgi:hypothetical protein
MVFLTIVGSTIDKKSDNRNRNKICKNPGVSPVRENQGSHPGFKLIKNPGIRNTSFGPRHDDRFIMHYASFDE